MASRPAPGAATRTQAEGQPLAYSLRGLLRSGLGLAQVRLELLSVEVREEVARLGRLWLLATLACGLVSVGLVYVSMLLTVAFWDSHRLLVLAVFAVLFLTLGGVALWLTRQALQQGSRLFEASLAELRADRDRLNS